MYIIPGNSGIVQFIHKGVHLDFYLKQRHKLTNSAAFMESISFADLYEFHTITAMPCTEAYLANR